MIACDIVWDSDGDETGLPNVVNLPKGINADTAADWLSDEYGWCVLSLTVEV